MFLKLSDISDPFNQSSRFLLHSSRWEKIFTCRRLRTIFLALCLFPWKSLHTQFYVYTVLHRNFAGSPFLQGTIQSWANTKIMHAKTVLLNTFRLAHWWDTFFSLLPPLQMSLEFARPFFCQLSHIMLQRHLHSGKESVYLIYLHHGARRIVRGYVHDS